MGLGNHAHRLRYFCSDAWDEWRHSLAVNLMALMTLVSALFVAGLIMLIVANVEHRVAALRDEVKVEVFLQDGQDDGARHALVRQLRGRAGVQRVDYVDKDEALRRYREWASDLAELVNEPSLLLADEPTGNLDPDLAVEIMRLFREINARGTTILVATHDRDLIQRMQRRTVVLKRGRVVDAGEAA